MLVCFQARDPTMAMEAVIISEVLQNFSALVEHVTLKTKEKHM